jgi:hypothetical protein
MLFRANFVHTHESKLLMLIQIIVMLDRGIRSSFLVPHAMPYRDNDTIMHGSQCPKLSFPVVGKPVLRYPWRNNRNTRRCVFCSRQELPRSVLNRCCSNATDLRLALICSSKTPCLSPTATSTLVHKNTLSPASSARHSPAAACSSPPRRASGPPCNAPASSALHLRRRQL